MRNANLVHCSAMTVQWCYRAIFEEIADVEQLVVAQAVLFARFRIRRYVIQFTKTP